MFFKKRFENAIKAHKSETIVLQNTVNEAIKNEESINQLREDNKLIIQNIEELINSIANTPKEFDDEFEALHSDYDNITELHSTEKYEHKLEVFLKVSNWFLTVGASLLAGVGISMIVPNDYNEYSEEHSLEEVDNNELYSGLEPQDESEVTNDSDNATVIIKGILAILGVGSVAIGTVIRPISYFHAARKIEEQVSEIKKSVNQLNKYIADLSGLYSNTVDTFNTVHQLYDSLFYLFDCDYVKISDQEKTRLWELVKYASVISELLHRKLEVS